MTDRRRYVAGLLLGHAATNDVTPRHVALVLKAKPDWQKGYYNAIGGKIEGAEHPDVAMRREFKEETQLDVLNWKRFAVLEGAGWRVYWYRAMWPMLSELVGLPDEPVSWHPVTDLPDRLLPNVRYLVEMAHVRNKRQWPLYILETAHPGDDT